MDLVAGVRKEGSRGGRDAFNWEDVKDDQHRENYLGHSLMAPVGRWQKNKDLSWYAKGDTSQAATDAAKARAEEIRRIKEAEQDALSEALGYPVQPRLRDNQLAGQKEVEKAIKDTADGDEEGGKGIGFGSFVGPGMVRGDTEEKMTGYVMDKGGLDRGPPLSERKEHRRNRSRSPHRRSEHRRRSRSVDRDRERRRRDRHHGEDRKSYRRYRSRSRSRSRDRHPPYRSRSTHDDRRRHRDGRPYRRTYSPRTRSPR